MANIQREIALTLYRWVTTPNRTRLASSFSRNASFPAHILFYHRVANHSMNEWSTRVKCFERHLDWIVQHATPASLDDIYATQLLGTRAAPMVGVTFDDGYSENCEYAIPKLLERSIPVTYFVSTHFVETGEPFPHDIARGVPLRPNTIDEIRRMSEQGVEIGAHSHTHVNFGNPLNEWDLRFEISDVRKRLQDWTGQSIDYFAFPYGLKQNITQAAIDVVFESGFKCFLSAAGGVNWPGHDARHLQRIHGDPGLASFKNWLTYDPRKIYSKSPIEYQMRTKCLR